MENALTKAKDAHQRVNAQTQAIQLEVNRLSMQAQSSGAGGTIRKKTMIDLKRFKIEKLKGDREARNALEDWRDEVENFMKGYHTGLEAVMQKAARWKTEIDDHEFDHILQELGTIRQSLTCTLQKFGSNH